ncbi:hypothetical protein V490_01213 [Pseudogymnoascus sp. VKM F-3557]|nr:hypothetical protein V490_01213 [Pseudogymnoascus sp. VKM F-3557]
MDSESIATAAEDPKPGLDANGGEAPSADNGQKELVHIPQPDAVDTAAKAIDNDEPEKSVGQSDAASTGRSTEAVEDPRPGLDSNGSESPSADNGQQELVHSPQPGAAETAAKAINNGKPEKSAGQSDALRTGQNMEAAENPRPSFGSDDNEALSTYAIHFYQLAAAHSAARAARPSNDAEIAEGTIQPEALNRNKNEAEPKSTRHSLSVVPSVDFDLVEEAGPVENAPITNHQSQSSRSSLSESDAKLETEQNLEPGHEPAVESVSRSGSGNEASSTFRVRLSKAWTRNLTPEEVKPNQALGQAIADGDPKEFESQLKNGANIECRFDDDNGDDDDDEEDDERGDINQSTLFLAARNDQPDIAKIILRERSDKDFLEDSTTSGWTPAHIAAQNGSYKVLCQIIEAGEKIGRKMNIINSKSTDTDSITPLIVAAREGHLDIVKMLVEEKAAFTTPLPDEDTPLHSAAYWGHKDVFNYLLDVKGAERLIEYQNVDGWTVLHSAARGGLEVASLFDHTAILEVTTKRTKSTALLIAASEGKKEIVILLLNAGSNILAKSEDGRTVLHMAAESGNLETLKEVANRIDRKTMALEDKMKGTALYSAAFWGKNFEAVCFLMGHEAFMPRRLEVGVSAKVNRRDIQELEKFLADYISNNGMKTEDGSPDPILQLIVRWAVFYGWYSIAKTCFEMWEDLCDLKTKHEETLLHVAACNGHDNIVRLLLNYFRGREGAAKIAMPTIDSKEKDGIIALHFAAGNNHLEITQQLLEEDSRKNILTESKNGATALYFAARNGHEDIIKYFLTEMKEFLPNIIRKKTRDKKTPLSQAAENGHKDVAKAMLEVLIKYPFDSDPKVAWDELTDIARTGFELYVVKSIVEKKIQLPDIPGTSRQDLFPNQTWTGLLLAVYYSHYDVVWWLLRRNGPAILTSPIFEDATDMVVKLKEELSTTSGLTAKEKAEKEERYTVIKDCLYSPPRVENKSNQYDLGGTPKVPQLPAEKETVCKEYRATIVDFYNKDNTVSFVPVTRSIYETIYDKSESIDRIMAGAETDRKEPKSLRGTPEADQPTVVPAADEAATENPVAERPAAEEPIAGETTIKEPAAEEPASRERKVEEPTTVETAKDPTATAQKAGTQRHPPTATATRQEQELKPEQIHDDGYKFRWIHVPANNMEWIERQPLKTNQPENMRGKLEQSSKSKVATNPETNLVPNTEQETSYSQRESGAEMNAASNSVRNVALYMPYLTFSKAYVGKENPVQLPNTLGDRLVGAYGREKIHELRTLDRFYYTSLSEEDIQKRNKDQVLTKYIKKKKNENGTSADQPEISNEDETGLILQVDQLWLWVIDGDKIITSSSYQTDGEPDIILKRVFKHLIEGRDERHPPSSPEQLLQLIVSSATGVIEQQKVILPEKGLLLSVLDIFENAIGDIEDKEINLFQKFEKTLLDTKKPDDKKDREKEVNKIKETDHEDQFDLIREAITHLVSIKDILDELSILKSLVKDQKNVWHDAFLNHTTDAKSLVKDEKKVWRDSFSEYTIQEEYMNSREPSEILETLDEMIADATRVERSINDLLDLKQKQANLSEAQSSRIQAEQTLEQGVVMAEQAYRTTMQGKEMARQGRTLMVFTIVTIIFLPMSFLAALFALDITVFPHATDKLSYTPGWIFPMIFGPSAAMSIPAIYFAFHVEKAISIWEGLKNPLRIFWPKVKDKSKTSHGACST